MDRLTEIIGKAPSELPYIDFLAKLTQERERVRRSLASFRVQKQMKPNKANIKLDKILPPLESLGLTSEQFTKALELIKKEKIK